MTLSLPWVRQWKAQKQPSEARFCTVLREREHERERCWLDSLFSLLIMSFSIYDWQIKCLLMKWGTGGEEGQKGRGEAEIDFCGQRRRKAVHEIHYIPKQWAQEKKSFSFCTDNKPASRWMETSISHTGMINHTHTHTDVKRLWWVYASLCAVKACLKLPWARKYKGNRTVITEACWAINSPVRHVRPVLTQEMKACYRDLTIKEQIKPFHRHLEATYDNHSSDSYRSKANWDEPYLLRDILRHPIYSFSLTSTYNVSLQCRVYKGYFWPLYIQT